MNTPQPLAFETEIHEMEIVVSKLEQVPAIGGNSDEIKRLRRELSGLIRKKYANLSPWETVLVSRHPARPQMMDYVDSIFEEFVELHGDRAFGDDQAILGGLARFRGEAVLVMGHEREGISDRVRAQCDAVVAIPGSGAVESLNVAVAAGVMISELVRSKR